MKRAFFLESIKDAFRVNPIVGLLGPRQCGKTTLARDFVRALESRRHPRVHYFDLEDPRDLARFEDPMLALAGLNGWIVLDEVQRVPRLFEVLRVLADRRPRPARFLVLGSASRELIRQTSETLAGRITYVELPPFTTREIPRRDLERLWLRGGFPRSFLASNTAISFSWREAYIANYLERDLPSLGIQIPAASLRKFWLMLAHYHGQLFNASEIGRSLGIAHTTVQRYLDILSGTFMVRQLIPWAANLRKRQVKAPKIYFRDSGIFHALQGIHNERELRSHPKLGTSWEGFALEEVIQASGASPQEVFFWGTHNQAELDLLILKHGKRIGYEVKYTSAPKVTPSMRIAMKDLQLDRLAVIFPGRGTFPLAKGIEAIGLSAATPHDAP